MNNVVYDIDRFLEDLNKFLAEKNISQVAFARMFNLSTSKVSRLLNGTRVKMSTHLFAELSAFMGVSSKDYLIGTGYVFKTDPSHMSIEEIDILIDSLREVRRSKLDEALNNLKIEQERLLKLKSMED